VLVGPADEIWDGAGVVRYPDIGAFRRIVVDLEYVDAAEPYRLAALAARRLVVTTPCGKRLVAASLGDAWIVRSAAVDLARSG
jgi:hypothetical protein